MYTVRVTIDVTQAEVPVTLLISYSVQTQLGCSKIISSKVSKVSTSKFLWHKNVCYLKSMSGGHNRHGYVALS